MSKAFVLTTLVAAALALSSCVHSMTSASVGNIAVVETMLHPDQPFYYQGRKDGCDHFLFSDDGVERRLRCPERNNLVKAPFPYTQNRSRWTTLNGRMIGW